MCGPFGPASTSAISSCSDHGPAPGWLGLDADRLLSARCVDLVDHDQPGHVLMQSLGERPPLGQVVGTGAEQVQVRGELHRAGEQFPRQRLRPVQPPLQQHLLAYAGALSRNPLSATGCAEGAQ